MISRPRPSDSETPRMLSRASVTKNSSYLFATIQLYFIILTEGYAIYKACYIFETTDPLFPLRPLPVHLDHTHSATMGVLYTEVQRGTNFTHDNVPISS